MLERHFPGWQLLFKIGSMIMYQKGEFYVVIIVCCFMVLGFELRAVHLLAGALSFEPYPQTSFCFIF
jgi:hypothetical protein